MEARAAFRTCLAREVEEHRRIARPALAEEDAVDDLRSLDQSGQHFAIVRRKLRHVRRDLGRRKAGGHLFELCQVGLARSSALERWPWSPRGGRW